MSNESRVIRCVTRVRSVLLGAFLIMAVWMPSSAHAQSMWGNRNFCDAGEKYICGFYRGRNDAKVSNALDIVGGSMTGLKIVMTTAFLASNDAWTTAKQLKAGANTIDSLSRKAKVLTALRAFVPILNANSKILEQLGKNRTKYQNFYRFYKKASGVWDVVSAAYLGMRATSLLFCKDIRWFGQSVAGLGKCAMPREEYRQYRSPFDMDQPSGGLPQRANGVWFVPDKCASFNANTWRSQTREVNHLKSSNGSMYHAIKNKVIALRRSFKGYKSLGLNVRSLWVEIRELEKLRDRANKEYYAMSKWQKELKRKKLMSASVLRRHKNTRNHISSWHKRRFRTADLYSRSLAKQAAAKKKQQATAKKINAVMKYSNQWKADISKVLGPCTNFESFVVSNGNSLKSTYQMLQQAKKDIAAVNSRLQAARRKLKPVLSATSKLISAMRKRICVWYSIKVKVKNLKFWEWKVKKVKYCTTIEKVVTSLDKLVKPARKLLDKAARKVLDPILREIRKRAPKISLGNLTGIQRNLERLYQSGTKLGHGLSKHRPKFFTEITRNFKNYSKVIRSQR